ncbi:MAG TPA: hypothetical protein VLF68_00515 [Candidatus Saccharimonadales bacterium]|nr:hypothetical protein [Candidatus Saccharimonadales bacterium]
MKYPSTHNCFQCGAKLIFVSKVTQKVEGSRFPQTSVIYRCSNKACQEEKDKMEIKRIKLKEERDVADQKRVEEKLQKKMELLSLGQAKRQTA